MAIATVLQLLAVSTLSLAAPWKRSPLEVQLVHVNDTSISASITNTGRKSLSFLHRNSILDPNPSRKLHVAGRDAIDAPFHGMHAHCGGTPSALDFTVVPAGETLYRDVDVAELYGLDVGVYDIAARGSLPYASDDSLFLTGDSLSFSSNVLELAVSASKAESLAQAQLAKRTTFESDCSGEQLASVKAATQDCAEMASAAADAATSGDASFLEKYFMDSSESTRSKVAEVFQSVAKECSNTPGGASTSHCTDQMNHCSGGVLAYTYWQGYGQDQAGEVYYCPSYYSLPQDGSYCHAQTQGGNVLHEMTHAVAGTDDLGYGYDSISALSTDQALMNADTYTLFAEDLRTGCNGASSGGSGSSGGSSGSGSGTGSGGSPTSSGAPEQPAPSEVPSSPDSDGYGWPGSTSGDDSSGSSGYGSDSPWTWTWSSGGQSSQAEDTSSSSSSSSQTWNEWLNEFMKHYGGSNQGTTEASVSTGSKIATDDTGREFGDGADNRGHDHTHGFDDHGHWTD